MPAWSRLLNPAAKFRKLKALNAWQWRVLLQSEFILPLASLRLRRGGYKNALAWVASPKRSHSKLAPQAEYELARQTAVAVGIAAYHGLWRPRCLARSLALGWFLSRRGIPFEICLGVSRGGEGGTEPPFSAHAWVEYEGKALNDRADVRDNFPTFERPPGERPGDSE